MKIGKRITAAMLAFAFVVGVIGQPLGARALEDNIAPTITSLSVTPAEFNTADTDQVITVTVAAEDNAGGVGLCPNDNGGCANDAPGLSGLSVTLRPLMGVSTQSRHLAGLIRTSGDINGGVYQGSITIPRGSKSGIWYVANVSVSDRLGNGVDYIPKVYIPTKGTLTRFGSFNAKDVNEIPSVTGLEIANTDTASQVAVDGDFILKSQIATAKFSAGTVITRKDGGSYAIYQMVTQSSDINNVVTDGLTGTVVGGAIRMGIPNLNLSFSKPVEISLNVGYQYEKAVLSISSLSEGGTSWANETTCTVSDGVCKFTTNHATYFAASQKGKINLKVNQVKKTNKSAVVMNGVTAKGAKVKVIVNGVEKKTVTASKKSGTFKVYVSLAKGKNTVRFEATSGKKLGVASRTVTRSTQK